jgi:hypothetical protein
MTHSAAASAVEPAVPGPLAAVARHRPGLVLLVALIVPVAAWTRDPLLVVSGVVLVALLVLRVRLVAGESRGLAGATRHHYEVRS